MESITTGILAFDWALLSLSLLNAMLIGWLGLTVLLNAERRTWSIWVTGAGLMLGGAFFVSHSAILGQGIDYVSRGMTFWWLVGWIPAILLPLAWYLVMLWYAGYWDDTRAALHRRQRPWLVLIGMLTAVVIALLALANPLPTYAEVVELNLAPGPSVAGIPLLFLAYPVHILLCIALSLDVLRRPGPSSRLMGDLARRRARPWLIGAAVCLLLISLLVTCAMFWIMINARQRAILDVHTTMRMGIAWFDLTISGIIACATILLGQAVVAYEVFTGKTLPRRGFRRYWRNAVILSAGFGTVAGGSLAISLRPIYTLLLTTIVITVFYALFSWRSYHDREQFIHRLRPFVASQDLYDTLVSPSSSQLEPATDTGSLLRALCEDVLDCRLAYLVGLGPMAPLVGAPLAYPPDQRILLPHLAELTQDIIHPETVCLPLQPGEYAGATWAVPLWSERGLIGLLLLGMKRDGGLYTQEEMEISRAAGERLIDTQAGAEMARRLMSLQRQRLTETQLLDQRSRRVLHDEVLPLLHAALLSLGSRHDTDSEAVAALGDAHRQVSDLLRDLPASGASLVSRVGLLDALGQTTAATEEAFDRVAWHIEPEAECLIDRLSPVQAEVVYYATREAVRNAARHGRGMERDGQLTLQVSIIRRDGLQITIEDNGVGVEAADAMSHGAGQGLALHSTLMAVAGGSLELRSQSGEYTRVILHVPEEVSDLH